MGRAGGPVRPRAGLRDRPGPADGRRRRTGPLGGPESQSGPGAAGLEERREVVSDAKPDRIGQADECHAGRPGPLLPRADAGRVGGVEAAGTRGRSGGRRYPLSKLDTGHVRRLTCEGTAECLAGRLIVSPCPTARPSRGRSGRAAAAGRSGS